MAARRRNGSICRRGSTRGHGRYRPICRAEVWQRLPSRADQDHLIASARTAYRVPDAVQIAIAPGTQALIQWLPRLAPPGPVAIMGPTYGEHALTWRTAGHEVVALSDSGNLPERARHAVIVNPNNPDGRVVGPDMLERIAAPPARTRRLADPGRGVRRCRSGYQRRRVCVRICRS